MVRSEFPDLAVTREDTLARAQKITGSNGAVLFELEDHRAHYSPVLFAGTAGRFEGDLSGNSLLIKWLRANREPLEVPDAIGVFENLSTDEREALHAGGLSACLPLVHDGTLVAVVGLVQDSGKLLSVGLQRAAESVQSLAVRLFEAKNARRYRIRAEGAARTNRLSMAGHLAASIAHEVRNPLAAIRSTVQLLHDDIVATGDRKQFLGNVLEEVDRVSGIVQQMLSAGRLREATYEICDLVTVAGQAIEFLRAYTALSNQRIERTGALTAPVYGDPFELRQVLVNLLLNACQASGSGAVIRVECNSDGGMPGDTVVKVLDSGSGIQPDQLTQVFEPFFTTKADGGGLGLGICREIVRRHGGQIQISSHPGAGTTVTVRLPQAVDHGQNSRR